MYSRTTEGYLLLETLKFSLALYLALEKYFVHISTCSGFLVVPIVLIVDVDMEHLHLQSSLKRLQHEDHTSIILPAGNPCYVGVFMLPAKLF
jgi:hypothetical protein